MSDDKVLTKEIAEQFLADNRSVDLSEFTEIKDAAAEILAYHCGGLWLDGLKNLSDYSASCFSKQEGSLSLNGLTQLSWEGAESLGSRVEVSGSWISLNSVRTLSNDAAHCLARWTGTLYLEGLEDLSGDCPGHMQLMTAMVNNYEDEENPLCFGKLSGLPNDIAELLSRYQHSLILDGITELSDEAIKSLSNSTGPFLSLDGMTSLSDEAAESLRTFGGQLYLNGLDTLSDLAAKSLSKREANFESEHINLDALPESAAQILRDAGHG